ncbi:MAG: MgtC/SapB family protein [Hyphomicrobiaceae bacterium]
MIDSLRTHLPESDIAIRFVLAAILGGLIGLERELKDRPAGLRTNMLTSLAAAVFTVLTFEIYHAVKAMGTDRMDPIRIIEAVTAGVAFLAAGTIIKSGGKVEGLTTGAGMWLAGAIGVSCGAGFYILALIATVLAGTILVGLHWFERHILEQRKEHVRRPED